MTEFRCSSYAQLARSLMEKYRDIPAGEILSMSAGVSCPDNDAAEIHKAMAKHLETCEFCRGNSRATSRNASTR